MARAALWFGLLGGAAAWTLHLLLAYLIAEFGCVAEKDAIIWAGITKPAWMLLVMSAVMLAVAGAATWAAHLAGKHPGRHDAEPPSVERYMARTGVIMSGLFTFIILVQSIPAFFYLQSC
jgi:hypothetical protein